LVAALAKRTLLASSSASLRSSAVRSGARLNINGLVYHRRKALGLTSLPGAATLLSDALVAILLGMAVAEAGFVTASVPLTVAATDGVGDNERGLASGVLSTATELGNALGFAAVGAVIAAATATGPVGVDALLSGL